jgi:hypothetical protein
LQDGGGEACQQPGGETPGVAAAPVALAGAIMPGLARSMLTLSLQAAEFGVGMAPVAGSMLVSPSVATTGSIVPGDGPDGTAGVVSGKVAPLIEDVAVLALQPVGAGFPSAVIAIVPVVLPKGVNGVVVGVASGMVVVVGIVPIAAVLAAVVAMLVDGGAPVTSGGTGIGGAVTSPSVTAETAGVTVAEAVDGAVVAGPLMVPSAGVGVTVAMVTVTGAVAGIGLVAAAWNVVQLTLVPGVVGSRASGSGASVVSAAPDWVAAENGLGPLKGDDTIAPGVDGSPMAVVPMVETCATQAVPPSRSAAVA